MEELECPARSDDLYLARGGDVDPRRPILTGDVFEGIAIPGVPDGGGLAIVITHPCSMRGHEGHLQSHVQMARIEAGAPIPIDGWGGGHFRFMPLPDLLAAGDLRQRAVFELSGRVGSDALLAGRRIACMQEQGILLLMQRIAFHFTRVAIETNELLDHVADVFAEAELLDEWLMSRIKGDASTTTLSAPIHREEALFDALMSEDVEGATLRDQLKDRTLRPRVRRAVRERMRVVD